MEKRMNMRDFVRTMKNDIDVYNNVTDDDGICYCPPVEFTAEGEKYFGWTLDNVFLNADEDNQWAEVICDEGDYPWQLIKLKAFDLLYAMAGYCSEENYNKWFKQEDKNMLNEQLHNELAAFLKANYHEFDEENKCFFDEAYTDYEDYVSDKDLGDILDSDDPEQALEEMLWDCYAGCEWQYRDDIVSGFLKTPEGSKYDREEIDDELVEMWYFKIPKDHYFEQEVNVDIVVDTGDANYDYTLNAVYPHYNGREDDEIDDKASLVWLAKTQGYTREQLQNYLTNGKDKLDVKGFLETVYQEVINCSASCPALFIPIKMTIRQLLKINKIINARDKNGYVYDPDKRKDCGSLIIDKNVDCALYDSWAGGGGCWGIELEKDIKLPIKFIHKAVPDGCLDYSMEECYGVTSDCWKDALKEIKD